MKFAIPETPLEEVTDVLYDKGVNFMLTHDMKLTLPETFFHGSTLKISPRALTKTGALVHIELEPKVQENGEGRIFFKKISKLVDFVYLDYNYFIILVFILTYLIYSAYVSDSVVNMIPLSCVLYLLAGKQNYKYEMRDFFF